MCSVAASAARQSPMSLSRRSVTKTALPLSPTNYFQFTPFNPRVAVKWRSNAILVTGASPAGIEAGCGVANIVSTAALHTPLPQRVKADVAAPVCDVSSFPEIRHRLRGYEIHYPGSAVAGTGRVFFVRRAPMRWPGRLSGVVLIGGGIWLTLTRRPG